MFFYNCVYYNSCDYQTLLKILLENSCQRAPNTRFIFVSIYCAYMVFYVNINNLSFFFFGLRRKTTNHLSSLYTYIYLIYGHEFVFYPTRPNFVVRHWRRGDEKSIRICFWKTVSNGRRFIDDLFLNT